MNNQDAFNRLLAIASKRRALEEFLKKDRHFDEDLFLHRKLTELNLEEIELMYRVREGKARIQFLETAQEHCDKIDILTAI